MNEKLKSENENCYVDIRFYLFFFILNAYNRHLIFIVYIQNLKLILYY